jgi:hypothetical protein
MIANEDYLFNLFNIKKRTTTTTGADNVQERALVELIQSLVELGNRDVFTSFQLRLQLEEEGPSA